jgi:hypothetical protein
MPPYSYQMINKYSAQMHFTVAQMIKKYLTQRTFYSGKRS